MPKVIHVLMSAAALTLVAVPVHANDLDGLEMDVIGIDERPDAAARRIELPEAEPRPREENAEDVPPGLDTASEARERSSELGEETAEQAREGKGPPDDIGGPDDPGEQGNNGRPENPGQGDDNRPEDPGHGGGAPEQPGGERPDQAGNGDEMGSGNGMNEAPDDNRPDAGGNDDRTSDPGTRPDTPSGDDASSDRRDQQPDRRSASDSDAGDLAPSATVREGYR